MGKQKCLPNSDVFKLEAAPRLANSPFATSIKPEKPPCAENNILDENDAKDDLASASLDSESKSGFVETSPVLPHCNLVGNTLDTAPPPPSGR